MREAQVHLHLWKNHDFLDFRDYVLSLIIDVYLGLPSNLFADVHNSLLNESMLMHKPLAHYYIRVVVCNKYKQTVLILLTLHTALRTHIMKFHGCIGMFRCFHDKVSACAGASDGHTNIQPWAIGSACSDVIRPYILAQFRCICTLRVTDNYLRVMVVFLYKRTISMYRRVPRAV